MTVPKAIRDRLGVGPCSEVEFTDRGDRIVIEAAGSARGNRGLSRFDAWADSIRGLLDLEGRTTAEHMDGLRGPRDDLDPR